MHDNAVVPYNNINDNDIICNNVSTNKSAHFRVISINDPVVKCDKYCSNRIVTARYTWYNFVFKNLYEQFHNLANFYFLMAYATYFFIDNVNDALLRFSPLLVLLSITMIKDGIDDISRHLADRKLNEINYLTLNISSGTGKMEWSFKRASEIVVGDVIRCGKGQSFPCDLIILASSDPMGNVYVNTVNLDGESNVKKRYAIAKTQTLYSLYATNDLISKNWNNSIDLLRQMRLHIVCQNPTEDLNKFEGKLTAGNDGEEVSLQPENHLLRGCKLSHTEYIIGVVAYTGKETKVSMNSKPPMRKYSSREPKSNKLLLGFLLLTLFLTVLLSIISFVWINQHNTNTWYIEFESLTAWQFVRTNLLFHSTFSYIIPISIVMTIEFQQLGLAYFISNDLGMYNAEDNLRSRARNAQLADELGQVEYLFTDKTGTLTQNIMNLRLCGLVTNKEVYICPSEHNLVKKNSKSTETPESGCYESTLSSDATFALSEAKNNSIECHSPLNMFESLASTSDVKYFVNENEMNEDLKRLITIVSLCHTVDVTLNENEIPNTHRLIYDYEATSPDEKCLIEGASKFGVVYAGREIDIVEPTSSKLNIDYWSIGTDCNYRWSERKQYIVDAILEFDSTRRQMSVMVRYPNNTYHIHSKGAETAILNAEKCSGWCGDLRSTATKLVTDFAVLGLRTLVYATRQVNQQIYYDLLTEYKDANKLFGDERAQAKSLIYNKIECDMTPVFVTGVEDKLQVGARECVEQLREAGIQIWVLTGDKAETAISTSRASGHFSPEMTLIRITDCADLQSTAQKIIQQLEGLRVRKMERKRSTVSSHTSNDSDTDSAQVQSSSSKMNTRMRLPIRTKVSSSGIFKMRDKCCRRPGMAGEPIGLIVDGESIRHSLHPNVSPLFLELCMSVTTLLCFRMTPLQKASVVELVKTGLTKYTKQHRPPVTAAIGDGGNDVAMITLANIGFGIYGKEGLEAANAADYALAQFKCLHRLLLLHGQWSHYRITYTMLFFYHKCIVFVTTQVIFIFYAGYSETFPYGDVLFILYNLTMTSLICLIYGLFEQHITEYSLLSKPHLYKTIQKQANLKVYYVIFWVMDGAWQGVIVYYISHFLLAGGFHYSPAMFYDLNHISNGNFDLSLFGCGMYIYTWLTVTIHAIIWIRNMNLMVWIGIGCTIPNFVILMVYQLFAPLNGLEYLSFTKLATSPIFWLGIPLTVVLANLPVLLWRIISDAWWTLQLTAKSTNYKPSNYWKETNMWLKALVYNRDQLLDE